MKVGSMVKILFNELMVSKIILDMLPFNAVNMNVLATVGM